MRKSTVVSLTLQLVFPGQSYRIDINDINPYLSGEWGRPVLGSILYDYNRKTSKQDKVGLRL